MTNEEIKRIIADEQTEQLTALFCHHWDVATRRLEELTQELDAQVEICVEADIYAVVMRMQRAVMALAELNQMPCAYLFSEYTDRIGSAIARSSIRSSIMTIISLLQDERPTTKKGDFLDYTIKQMTQNPSVAKEQQDAINQKVAPMQLLLSICSQNMDPSDLMMFVNVLQELSTEDPAKDKAVSMDFVQAIRQMTDELSAKMSASLQKMAIWLLILVLFPDLILKMIKLGQGNSKAMATLFNKVLVRVRKSNNWYDYWKNRRDTLRVVSDSCSWSDIMTAERAKVLAELGKVPGALFAKWSTDREAFDADFLDVNLDDDTLRHFIFHLTYLCEIARELDPTTRFGDEYIANTEVQQVGDAVMAAARRLVNLVDDAWLPHYDQMWKELIENETVFAHLKVTRKSPHNNLFTARFFCHMVGEMKKSTVFGVHSDNDLAEKLTDKRSVGTFRKNIQEGLCENEADMKNIFRDICLKYRRLAHPKR